MSTDWLPAAQDEQVAMAKDWPAVLAVKSTASGTRRQCRGSWIVSRKNVQAILSRKPPLSSKLQDLCISIRIIGDSGRSS
ncbi:hypothetical protein ACYULU_16270 [Breznakiellaceae bacterium SP9]